MKKVFVINPAAGQKNSESYITDLIKKSYNAGEYEIYSTTKRLDAWKFVKEYLETTKEDVCFISCGGDGTLNEVVSGAYGYENAYVSCFPSGSGNDFIKNFGKKEDFLNIANFKDYKVIEVDLMQVNDRYAINVCNLGFDARVAHFLGVLRRFPFVSGKMAYNIGIVFAMFTKFGEKIDIELDGVEVKVANKVLLSAVFNGTTYGGGYRGGPDALVNDGILDIVRIKKVSRFKIAKLISEYKVGNFKNNPAFDGLITCYECHDIKYQSKVPFYYTLDGELLKNNVLTIKTIPKAIKFIIPSFLSYNGI